MTKFIYNGDTSSHTSIAVNGQLKAFSLYKNHEYELPEKDPLVKVLIGQKLLTEVKPETKTETKAEKKSFKKLNLK